MSSISDSTNTNHISFKHIHKKEDYRHDNSLLHSPCHSQSTSIPIGLRDRYGDIEGVCDYEHGGRDGRNILGSLVQFSPISNKLYDSQIELPMTQIFDFSVLHGLASPKSHQQQSQKLRTPTNALSHNNNRLHLNLQPIISAVSTLDSAYDTLSSARNRTNSEYSKSQKLRERVELFRQQMIENIAKTKQSSRQQLPITAVNTTVKSPSFHKNTDHPSPLLKQSKSSQKILIPTNTAISISNGRSPKKMNSSTTNQPQKSNQKQQTQMTQVFRAQPKIIQSSTPVRIKSEASATTSTTNTVAAVAAHEAILVPSILQFNSSIVINPVDSMILKDINRGHLQSSPTSIIQEDCFDQNSSIQINLYKSNEAQLTTCPRSEEEGDAIVEIIESNDTLDKKQIISYPSSVKQVDPPIVPLLLLPQKVAKGRSSVSQPKKADGNIESQRKDKHSIQHQPQMMPIALYSAKTETRRQAAAAKSIEKHLPNMSRSNYSHEQPKALSVNLIPEPILPMKHQSFKEEAQILQLKQTHSAKPLLSQISSESNLFKDMNSATTNQGQYAKLRISQRKSSDIFRGSSSKEDAFYLDLRVNQSSKRSSQMPNATNGSIAYSNSGSCQNINTNDLLQQQKEQPFQLSTQQQQPRSWQKIPMSTTQTPTKVHLNKISSVSLHSKSTQKNPTRKDSEESPSEIYQSYPRVKLTPPPSAGTTLPQQSSPTSISNSSKLSLQKKTSGKIQSSNSTANLHNSNTSTTCDDKQNYDQIFKYLKDIGKNYLKNKNVSNHTSSDKNNITATNCKTTKQIIGYHGKINSNSPRKQQQQSPSPSQPVKRQQIGGVKQSSERDAIGCQIKQIELQISQIQSRLNDQMTTQSSASSSQSSYLQIDRNVTQSNNAKYLHQ